VAPSVFATKPKDRPFVWSRGARPRLLAAMAATLSSFALVVGLWPGTALAVSKHPVSYFNLHPCALFTEAQAGAAVHSPITKTTSEPGAQYGGACLYGARGKPNVDLSFAPGPISSLSFVFPGKPKSERSVVPGSICIVVSASSMKQSHAPDPANFLVPVPGTFVVDVSTANCAEAVPLAKIAVAEIS
jgi:hypothetical protein